MPPRSKPVLEIRKPPADHAPDVEAFVQGAGADVQTSRLPNVQPARLPKKQRRQVTLYLSLELARRLKLRSVELGREMSELAEEAIGVHLTR